MQVLSRLIHALFELMLLRIGPQHLPRSQLFAGIVVVLCLVSLIVSNLLARTPNNTVTWPLVLVGGTCLAIGILMASMGKASRLPQVLSAYYGSGLFLNVILMPLYFMIGWASGNGVQLSELFGIYYIGVLLWGFVVTAHIFRHALGGFFGTGMMVAIGLFALQWTLSEWMFSPVAAG